MTMTHCPGVQSKEMVPARPKSAAEGSELQLPCTYCSGYTVAVVHFLGFPADCTEEDDTTGCCFFDNACFIGDKVFGLVCSGFRFFDFFLCFLIHPLFYRNTMSTFLGSDNSVPSATTGESGEEHPNA